MSVKNIFSSEVSNEILSRIEKLTASTPPKWGKMNVAQMLAHCSVTYEMIYTDKHPKPGAFMRFILKSMVKKKVVGEGTYPQSARTAPQFIIAGEREFKKEKERLVDFIKKTQQLGPNHFEGKESHSFGVLTGQEWNNMFYKHLDHHLNQFGV